MRSFPLLLAAMLLLGGCYRVSYRTSLDPTKSQAVATVTEQIRSLRDDDLFERLPAFVGTLLSELVDPAPPPAK